MSGQVFLVDCNNQRSSIHLLQDNESFKVGEIKFRWKYTHSDDVLEPGSTDPGSTVVEPGSTYAVKSGRPDDDEDVDKPGSADIVEPQSTVLLSPDATKSFSDLYTLEEKEGHHLNSDVLEPESTDPGSTDVEPGSTYAVKSRSTDDDEDVDKQGSADIVEPQSTVLVSPDATKCFSDLYTLKEKEGHHLNSDVLEPGSIDPGSTDVEPGSTYAVKSGSTDDEDVDKPRSADIVEPQSTVLVSPDATKSFSDLYTLEEKEGHHLNSDVLEPGSTDPGSTNVEPGSTYAVKSGSTDDDEDVDKSGSADIVEPQSTVLVSPDATKSFSDLYTLEEKEGHHLNSDCRIESREARSTDKHTAVSCVAKSSADRSRKIQKLSDEQSKVLRRLFSANVTCRRELKRHECEKAIRDHTCLNELSWKKVKNTIHNWITTEKRKQTKFN